MSSIHRIGIHFFLRAERKDKLGNAPIYMLLTQNNSKVAISINQKVPLRKWNAAQEKVSGADATAKSINNQIDILRAKVIESVNSLTLQQKHISLEMVKSMVVSTNDTSIKKTLLNAARLHNDEMKEFIGVKYCYKTFQYYFTTARFLQQFLQQQFHRNDIHLEEIDLSFSSGFEKWLLRNTKSTNNGMAKHIQRLKKIINWSIREGWIGYNPIKMHTVNFEKFERGYLTMQEIQKLENTTLSKKHLNVAKELFLFQIFTGLSHADLASLSWENIQLNHQGNDWIIKPREKTSILITVPLLPKAKSILDSRKQQEATGRIFRVYANQPYNRYLKEIADEVGIKKRLTSHIARHTFATTITLSNGVPIETVSRMLGHTKISTTQIYSKVTTDKIAADMGKLIQK